jgi:DNA polymerase
MYHLDFETRSTADIKRTGAFRYAEDPSTEILCAAIACDDEEPLLWVNPKFAFDDMSVCRSSPGVDELIAEMNRSDAPVYAHNAYFEQAITNHCPNNRWFKIDYRRWRCTAAMSRRAAIPPSLEKAAETLGLLQQKDSKGKALIRKFSIPQKASGKFIQPIDRQDDFIAFCNYCLQDVRVEQGIHKTLKHFELTGDTLAAFQADLAINSRGLPVNLPALRHAQTLIEANEARMTEEFRELAGFNPTQRDVLLKWLKEHGYEGDNLRADTLDEQLESAEFDSTSEIGRVLQIKKSLSFASNKKVKAMIECACADSRVRGTIQFYGAGPGRASGRLVQPQNFKRPTIKNTDDAYTDIMAGASEEHIELFYGPLLEVIGSCIRHFIHDEGGPIFDVDFSSIEARIAAWLAGEEWKLEVFRTHGKIYEATICRMTGMPLQEMLDYAKEHGKHHPDRQKGKVADLSLGFQGGPDALETMGRAYDWEVTFTEEELQEFILEYQKRNDPKKPKIKTRAGFESKLKEAKLQKIVDDWREANPNIVKTWYAYDRAAKAAVSNFGSRHQAGKIEFFCAVTAGSKYLFAKLPSGRRLAYRDPQITETVCRDKETGEIETYESGKVKTRQTLSYWGQIRGKAIWGRCAIYGGMWMQNFTEAIGADLLNNGIIKSEAAGYEVCSLIHDQILAYTREGQSIEELVGLMTDVPDWTKGLPVAADGQVQPYYTK